MRGKVNRGQLHAEDREEIIKALAPKEMWAVYSCGGIGPYVKGEIDCDCGGTLVKVVSADDAEEVGMGIFLGLFE